MERLGLDARGGGRWGGWAAPLLMMAAALAVTSPVIFGGGFFWDDYTLIVSNAVIRRSAYGGGRTFWKLWFSRDLPDSWPLTYVLFWVEWRAFGMAAGAYHLVNAVLHGATAIFLWASLRELRVRWALGAALLFAVHPVNMETASWIAEEKNTLATGLMMAAFWLWWRGERRFAAGSGGWWNYGGGVMVFVLSLLAKISGAMLPVVMLLVLWWKGATSWRAVLRTAPFFGASAVLGAVSWWFMTYESIADVAVRNDSAASRVATAGCAFWFYLEHAIAPVWIMFCYPRWEVMCAGAVAFVPGMLAVGMAAALFVLRRRIGRVWAAAWIAYAVMLLPVLGFANIFFMRYSLVSDHWQYPADGIVCAVLAGGAGWLVRRGGRGVAVAAGVLLAVYAADAAWVSSVYWSEENVWRDTLAHDPGSWLANEKTGEALLQRARGGEPELVHEAMGYFATAVAARPDQATSYIYLSDAYTMAGRRAEARQLLERAAALPGISRQELANAEQDLGIIRMQEGDAAGAEAEYLKSVEVNPRSVNGWRLVAGVRLGRGDVAGARQALERGTAAVLLSIDTRAELFKVVMRQGDLGRAAEIIGEVRDIDPLDPRGGEMEKSLRGMRSGMAETRAVSGSGLPASVPASLPGNN